MNDLGDVLSVAGAVVLCCTGAIVMFRIQATMGIPKPVRGDDGMYGFFGSVSFPLDGSPERNRPSPAVIRINDTQLSWKPDYDDKESHSLSSLKIIRASRFKRAWGATGAMHSGIDLLLQDGRILRVRLESNRLGGDTRRPQTSDSDFSKLAIWMERELINRGVAFNNVAQE